MVADTGADRRGDCSLLYPCPIFSHDVGRKQVLTQIVPATFYG